jgi:hypothetical protein
MDDIGHQIDDISLPSSNNIPFLVQPYSNDPKDIKNNFIHLTNYSVNKNSGEFVYNEAPGK